MLRKFPNSTLKLGAKVSLSPDHTWSRGAGNPVGVSGVVIRTEPPRMIQVRWLVGGTNSYSRDAYDLIAEGEPGYLSTE